MDINYSDHQDRLSELHNSLILLILSFLPMRDVVKTTLLSKRWKNLWTAVPCLNFCDIGDEGERVKKFVNSALKLWRGKKIMKFKFVFLSHFDMSLAGDIDSWVRFAVENKVEELSVHLVYDGEKVDWREGAVMCSKRDVYTLPQCLSSCSSLRKLSLVGCNLRLDVDPSWNWLESLVINGFCAGECLVSRILSGSPRLEVFELRLLESYEDLNIQSTSLKRLKVEKYLYFWYDVLSQDGVLRICCPNLETLEFAKISYCKCLFTDVSSLTDATLGFYDSWYFVAPGRELLEETLSQILPSIQHVEKLTLSVCSIEVLCALLRKRLLSPLVNVKFLKLNVELYVGFSDVKYEDLVNLLGIFPNIKMLFIEDHIYPIFGDLPAANYSSAGNESELVTNLSDSFLPQLKTIQIASSLSSSVVCRIVEFLLRQAIMLEKFVIRFEHDKVHLVAFLHKAAKILSSLPRSSSIANMFIQQDEKGTSIWGCP